MIIGIDASRAFVKDPAGPEYYSWHLCRSLAKIDSKNEYVLYLRPGQRVNYRLPKNFKTRTIPLKYLWTQAGLALETALRHIDILFVPAHTLPLLTRILRPRLPIVVTIHGLEGKYLPQSGNFFSHIYRNLSIGWAVRFATRLIAVSEDTKRDIINTYHKQSKDIKVIYEGVDYARFGRIKSSKLKIQSLKKYGITGEYILFVGTVQPRKNLVRLIKAFSLLAPDFPELKLVIAGKLGWLFEPILNAPKKYKIKDKVVFAGRIKDEDLPALYQKAQLFVFPSLTEGFGLPVLEAQAAGVPVIAAKKGALPEVAGEGALFIDPYKTQDLTRKMRKALTEKKLRAELVRKGRENARKFSWEKAAHNTLNYILEASGE